jgi:CDP-diacylglycerol---glycerol-3-phosphate 3-phosphatidyltransferase
MNGTGSPLEKSFVMRPLRRGALWAGGWHVLGLLGAFLGLLHAWPARAALPWLLQAFAWLGVVHLQLHRSLGEDHPPPGREASPSLGVANGITLGRGWGVSCLAGFLLLPQAVISGPPPWMAHVPGLLYLSVGCADFIDGLWARRTGTESALGQRLDVEMDALGLLAASLLAVRMGRLPVFYLAVGACYYIFRFAIAWRRRRGRIVLPLKDRPMARIMAGLNMGFVGAALLPLFAPRVLNLAAIYFSVPLVMGFVWDWLVVSGYLSDDRADRLQRLMSPARAAASLITRLVLLVCGPAVTETLFQTASPTVIVAAICLWVMIAVGWLGRVAALAAGFWLARAASSSDVPPAFLVALSAALVLTILGTGPWSWWKPEDACLSRKAGARSTPP